MGTSICAWRNSLNCTLLSRNVAWVHSAPRQMRAPDWLCPRSRAPLLSGTPVHSHRPTHTYVVSSRQPCSDCGENQSVPAGGGKGYRGWQPKQVGWDQKLRLTRKKCGAVGLGNLGARWARCSKRYLYGTECTSLPSNWRPGPHDSPVADNPTVVLLVSSIHSCV